MKRRHRRSLAAIVLVAAAMCSACSGPAPERTEPAPSLSLIPWPADVSQDRRGLSSFQISQATRVIAVPQQQAGPIANHFVELTGRTTPFNLQSGNGDEASSAIVFSLDDTAPGGEGYALTISGDRITVQAREKRGLFYGAVSLWQIVSAHAEGDATATLPPQHFRDAPRFAWRGLMLDVARHYVPPDEIKRLLDQMALHKLNTFHWHLTDDQGWRIEIRKYPSLTSVGAWRVPAGAGPAADIDSKTGKPRLYGGYYTQDEIRDIVRYAADRFITVVPEIEMPGHAQAAIAAYPRLGTEGPRPSVSSDWGVHDYLYNVDESTFAFLEDVLTEVIALFPGPYVHIGGDEAVKDRWRTSRRVQQRMRTLGVKDEAALQGYFTHRMEAFLREHGRRLVGWDEILEGELPPSAMVMSWRGEAGAIEAAKAGHDVIMSPAPALYLDYLQSPGEDEPPGRPNYVTLEDVYRFKVVPDGVGPEIAHHVLGAQINVWTEHMRTFERMEHAIFPRIAAFAEALWTPGGASDWSSFILRLPDQFARYEKLGIRYADSAYAVRLKGSGPFELHKQLSAGEIHYTLDGSDPTPQSPLYKEALALKPSFTLTAATFQQQRRMSEPRKYLVNDASLLRRSDDELRSCSGKLPLRLEDDAPASGPRAVFNVDILDPCWIYERADLSRVDAIVASVGQVPFNFQVGDAVKNIPLYPPQTPEGELEVRLDSCEGERVASLPLAPAANRNAVTTLPAVKLAKAEGSHDLCLRFTRRSIDPIWTIDTVQLLEQ